MPSTSTTAHNAKGNLASKAGVSYTYADTAHKHAVTALSNGNTYTYDANGNQVTRTVGSVTHTLTYDAENRLTKVMNGATTIATFVYDGDGQRVKSTLNGVTTSFVGNYYEKTGKNSTKYYYAGTARVAMRNTSVKYLFGDQLGSTSVTTSSSGAIGSQERYKPFGEMYYTSGTLPTRYTFTGQYSYANTTSEIGLMYYGARFYDPALGRFASADTIIPGAGNPMAWDRYAYTLNNPVKYTDPSGHWAKPGEKQLWTDADVYSPPFQFSRLPVDTNDITWIQWYGGTESAYQDHENTIAGKPNYNYDGYCQGYHCGLDMGAKWGTPVYAGVNGTVLVTGKRNGGYFVVVRYGDYEVSYEALDGNFYVDERDPVKPDTKIAGVGNHQSNPNGGNTHLHMEVRYSSSGHNDWKDRITNPLLFMNMVLYQELMSKVDISPYDNVHFHTEEQDPLKQHAPIVRGGAVLW